MGFIKILNYFSTVKSVDRVHGVMDWGRGSGPRWTEGGAQTRGAAVLRRRVARERLGSLVLTSIDRGRRGRRAAAERWRDGSGRW
jgi:hypothetical protein